MDRFWRCSWKRHSWAAASLLTFLAACGSPDPGRRLQEYVELANRHDLAAVEAMLADDVVWYLGPDTLRGVTQVMAPLDFDAGAQTHLQLGAMEVRGDTVEFELAEHSRVLMALGIPELSHHVRFVFRDGLIAVKESRRPPDEIQAFADSVGAFASWLAATQADAYRSIWEEDGRFRYSRETAVLFLEWIDDWRARDAR